MSFVAQVRLADVPALRSFPGLLASFHYCQECAYEGRMAWGWDDKLGNKGGYDVVFLDTAKESADQRGIVAASMVEPHTVVAYRDAAEVPQPDDLEIWDPPEDYPQNRDDFDEHIFPGLVHVARSKLGGWPTWVQSPSWPPAPNGATVELICQLDWWLCQNAPWCSGGYAYVFAKILPGDQLEGELALLTT
jgi:hypothetical protein